MKTPGLVLTVDIKFYVNMACGVCGRRVMANSVLCTKCENWVHGKCAKIKRATARLAMHFVCSKLVMYRYFSIGIGGIGLFLCYRVVVSVSVKYS